jgi:hypothetical protein
MSAIPEKSPAKQWLILSHGFNMDGRASSQTITDKIPYFLNQGIQLQVVSAITGIQDQRFPHRQLIAWGPAAFRFDFRHWISNRFGRGLIYQIFTPLVSLLLSPLILLEKWVLGYSSQWSWAMPAYFYGLQLIRSGKVNLIYSTGGAWSAHLAGLWLKKKTGLPWIVEIHDPLVMRKDPDDIGLQKPKHRDAAFRFWLEKQICQYADLAWWFTDGAVHYAKLRNPNLDHANNAKSIMVIPGAEPPAAHFKVPSLQNHKYTDTLNLYHFGSLANDRSLSQVLKVLPEFLLKYPEAKEKIKIHAYGAALDSLTKSSIEELNLTRYVIAHGRLEKDPVTGASGREQIAHKMQEADILLLLHGNTEWCSEYIPSKMYEYFWVPRPIWGITHRNPQMDQFLQERQHYLSEASNPKSIMQTFEQIWLDWQRHALKQASYLPIGVEQATDHILNHLPSVRKN